MVDDRFRADFTGHRTIWQALIGVILMVVCGCGETRKAGLQTPAAPQLAPGERGEIVLDFEQPDPPVIWQPAAVNGPESRPNSAETRLEAGVADTMGATSVPATAAATKPAEELPKIGRTSARPLSGLWSLRVTAEPGSPGAVVHLFSKPRDLRSFDTVKISISESEGAERAGEWLANVVLTDGDGRKTAGDRVLVGSRWRGAMLDLRTAAEEGLDLGNIVSMGVELQPSKGDLAEPLPIQTDLWELRGSEREYIGKADGAAKSFYARREGTRLVVGSVDQYEMTFFDRTGTVRPWLRVRRGGAKGQEVLGQAGTGLMLLDQGAYDAIGPGVREDAFDLFATDAREGGGAAPKASWPIQGEGYSEWTWECVWTSAVGAIVEGKQTVGPMDRLGRPAATLVWRFMVYQWGEVFVHVEWRKEGDFAPTSPPISWGLVMERNVMGEASGVEAANPGDAERLLGAVYPASVREGLRTALPHAMQASAPVAMIGRVLNVGQGGNMWWWARSGSKKVFGAGISGGGTSADCMLLVNGPTALMQAGSFAQYLVPPKVRLRQGELDRNFPGDLNNDGFVESYGFQVIRLANGRASFTIYPQERPLFYPVYLFTVPAIEREAVDLRRSRVLINIDGKQFADPPQFPDGSFLLQVPYVIDRPVNVEAVLVKR